MILSHQPLHSLQPFLNPLPILQNPHPNHRKIVPNYIPRYTKSNLTAGIYCYDKFKILCAEDAELIKTKVIFLVILFLVCHSEFISESVCCYTS